ncbi:hypothetical protein BKI49_22150 [Streptomyces sp. Tue6028]|uniref:hypothetical protein n=1 Tax=Streptomyces sp. Tue6028 TaxID=2036037 RepID=UPI000BB393D1|nr:hypothetical protein [Streptomyces sp. Tue6028]PBC61711.1 hypothetical protein BKI49_22150 [Streptomyces sp. Tue6028]
MSQSTPPPSGPPLENNPYAGQAPAPGQGAPQGAPQPGFPVAPVAPAAPVRDNLALGLAAAFVAALVAAGVYGAIIGLTKHEIGWAAVGVGFLVGLAAGRVGGRNQILPVASVILSVASIYLGQLVGEAMIGAKELGVGFNEVFFDHFDVVQEAWKEQADPLTFVFFAIAAYVAFSSTRKAGD